MKLIDEFRQFLTRERRWRWVLAALAFIVVGQVIERAKIDWMGLPERGKVLSFALYDRLRVIQLDTVAQRYEAAGEGRHGIAKCGPTERRVAPPKIFMPELPGLGGIGRLPAPPVLNPSLFGEERVRPGSLSAQILEDATTDVAPTPTPSSPLPPNKFETHGLVTPRGLTPGTLTPSQRIEKMLTIQPSAPPEPEWTCNGWMRLIDGAVLALRTTPEVAGELWGTGWFNRFLLIFTLGAVGGGIALLWLNAAEAGLGAPIGTGLLLVFGPWVMGLVFWLLLQVLLGLVLAVGWALAGISMVIGTAVATWKIAAAYVGALKQADDLEKNAARVSDAMDDLKR